MIYDYYYFFILCFIAFFGFTEISVLHFMCAHFNSFYCIQQKCAPVTLAPLSQWSKFFPPPCLVPKLSFLPTVFPSDIHSVILSEHLRPWYIILSQIHFCFFKTKKNSIDASERQSILLSTAHLCLQGPFLCHHNYGGTLVYVLLCIMHRGELLRQIKLLH